MKHDQIYEDLRHKILDGAYAPGDSLESEVVLCREYGVSRPTLQKAISRLKQDGMVHSRQGSGVFVNPSEFFLQNNLTTLSERYGSGEDDLTSEVLSFSTVPAAGLAETFCVEPSDLLIHYRRLRRLNGRPWALEETYMPRRLFPTMDANVLLGSVISYIEEECGLRLNHDRVEVRPVAADASLAHILDIEKGRPILRLAHYNYQVHNVLTQYTIEYTLEDHLGISFVR